MSSFDTIPHWLSSYAFRAPVLFWVAHTLWAWHLSTEYSFTERTTMSVLQQVLKKTSRQRPLSDQRAFSLSDSSIFPSLFVFPSGWRNVFLPTAMLVLRYVSNQTNRQKLLLGLRPEDLPVLRYCGVTLLRLPMFLKSSERSLNNQPKRRTLQLKSSYCWPTHRDGAMQINNHYNCDTSWV